MTRDSRLKGAILAIGQVVAGCALGAVVQAAWTYGLADFGVWLLMSSALARIHLLVLAPPVLLFWWLGRILTRWPAVARWSMTPFRWAAGLSLGPWIASLVFAVLPLPEPAFGWILLLGSAAALLLLRRLPPAPARARVWSLTGGAAGLLLASAMSFVRLDPSPVSPAPSSPSPLASDVVLICVDTLRADAVDALAGRLKAFERMEREGIRRPHALTPAPLTLPSHASMFTGLSPLEHGCRSNWHVLDPEFETVAERMAQEGLQTGAVVSNAVLSKEAGIAQGFATFDARPVQLNAFFHDQRRSGRGRTWLSWVPRERSAMRLIFGAGPHFRAETTTRFAQAQLDELRAKPQPYFLFVHYMDPHAPYLPDPSVRGSVSGAQHPPHVFVLGDGSHRELSAIEKGLREGQSEAAAALDYYHASYLEELLHLDSALAVLLEDLQADGRPTTVLLTSDHGEHFGEWQLTGHGNSLHWPMLEVPWLLWNDSNPLPDPAAIPAVPRIQETEALLRLAAGLAPAAASPRASHAVAWGSEGPELALTGAEDKIIAQVVGSDTEAPDFKSVRFYDLRTDSRELNDLAAAQEEALRRLLNLALGLIRNARPSTQREMTDSQRQVLLELGYAGS